MEPATALLAFGSVARDGQLRGVVPRSALRRALYEGRIVRTGRGVYALPPPTRARTSAVLLRGVRTHRSAAARWGFALPAGPDVDDITVARKARRTCIPVTVRLHYRDYVAVDIDGDVTSPVRTVVDCLRDLSLAEALSVADSALRSGLVKYDALAGSVAALRGPGSRLARRRLDLVDARAENAFESTCRAILIEAGISGFDPQRTIRSGGRWIGRADLAHEALKILIECESFAHHADRRALRRDCRRHSAFVAAGWLPLRFSWEDVSFDAGWVAGCVAETVAVRLARSTRRTKITAQRRSGAA